MNGPEKENAKVSLIPNRSIGPSVDAPLSGLRITSSHDMVIMSEKISRLTGILGAARDMDSQLEILSQMQAQNPHMSDLRGARFTVDGYLLQVALPAHVPEMIQAMEKGQKMNLSCTPRFVSEYSSQDQDSVVVVSQFFGSGADHRIARFDTIDSNARPSFQAYLNDLSNLAAVGLFLQRSDDPTNLLVDLETGGMYVMAIDFVELSPNEASQRVDNLKARFLGS